MLQHMHGMNTGKPPDLSPMHTRFVDKLAELRITTRIHQSVRRIPC
jgi:hypothetical protein